jgi:Cu/Ag efflux protein CusF
VAIGVLYRMVFEGEEARMRNATQVLGSLLCAAAIAGCSTTREQAAPAATAGTTVQQSDEGITRTDVVRVTATVESIDQKTRMVTLRGADGETTTFRVDDAVQNLPQVKKGDQVDASFVQSVAVQVLKPGEASPGITAAEDVVRAAPGQKPAAAGARTTTMTATVVKVDRKKQTVTLRGPEGNRVTVAVRNPANIEKVRDGDLVEITYTEAVAIAVQKPGAH